MRVAIVLHRQDSLDRRGYWLGPIAECWRAAGMHVDLIQDPAARLDADLAVLHVDLTVVPTDYVACALRASATVNGEVSDISKRLVSTHLVARGDGYDGPVIVKTNRNDNGRRELRVARKELTSSLRGEDLARHWRAYLSEQRRHFRRWRRYGMNKAFLGYPVFETVAAVPDAIWNDDDFAVERFLPERRDGRYCIRTWLFFGDRDRHAMFLSDHPVVKSHHIKGYEPLGDVPEELRQIRRDLKFDFGKFDYTMVDGRPVLFDANRTPSIGHYPRDRYLPIAQSLSEGIRAFGKQSA